MFKKIILTSIILSAATVQAQPCDPSELAEKALRGALALESINGGAPLSQEIHSLSSEYGGFIAILSYSGVQKLWKVKVDTKLCTIKSASKVQL